MSTYEKLDTINGSLNAIKTAIVNKGQTPSGDITTYAAAIDNIPSGGGSSIGIPREVVNGVFKMPTSNFSFSLPSGATDVGESALAYAFQGCSGLTSVDLSALTTISGANALNNAFSYCTNLSSVDLSALTTISGANALAYAFQGCSYLSSVSFPALTTQSFGTNSNQFQGMIFGAGSNLPLIEIDFPSNLESTISSLDGYPTFGGDSSSVMLSFDLPATS